MGAKTMVVAMICGIPTHVIVQGLTSELPVNSYMLPVHLVMKMLTVLLPLLTSMNLPTLHLEWTFLCLSVPERRMALFSILVQIWKKVWIATPGQILLSLGYWKRVT